MNFLSNWLIIGLLLILIAIFGVGCKTFFSNPKPLEKIKIADSVQLNQNWLELKLEKPLEVTDKHQIVGLKINNVKKWANDKQTKLLLADESQLLIEIELIDENENSTFLSPNGFTDYIEFGKRTKDFDNVENANFIIGTKFQKIRLRSDKNIVIEEIIWTEFRF